MVVKILNFGVIQKHCNQGNGFSIQKFHVQNSIFNLWSAQVFIIAKAVTMGLLGVFIRK